MTAILPEYKRNPREISERLQMSYTYIIQKMTSYVYRGYVRKVTRGNKTFYTCPDRGYLYKAVELYFNVPINKAVKNFDDYILRFKNGEKEAD